MNSLRTCADDVVSGSFSRDSAADFIQSIFDYGDIRYCLCRQIEKHDERVLSKFIEEFPRLRGLYSTKLNDLSSYPKVMSKLMRAFDTALTAALKIVEAETPNTEVNR